jgi:integrase
MTTKRRPRGDGGLYRRGESWTLQYRVTDGRTGRRKTKYATFKGSETATRAELRRLIRSAETGTALPSARLAVKALIETWEAGLTVGGRASERYKSLAERIRAHLGDLRVVNVRPSTLESFYRDLAAGVGPKGEAVRPLSSATVSYHHRIVSQIFSLALRDGSVSQNPTSLAKRPKTDRQEVEILDESQIRDVLQKLRGRSFYRIAAVLLATGMRRGEALALRWSDVDLERAVVRVERSLEHTKSGGLRFKTPKTKHGYRTITLPQSIVLELRKLRREQAEERLRLGLGREADDALIFRRIDPATLEATPILPNSVTTEWRRLVAALGLPRVSLHALRHTAASQWIAAGVDPVTVSRLLGHHSPGFTLSCYTHWFERRDGAAAAVFDKAVGHMFSD